MFVSLPFFHLSFFLGGKAGRAPEPALKIVLTKGVEWEPKKVGTPFFCRLNSVSFD